MTDLTEQWKKGELPSDWYYVRLIRGEYRTDLYINDKNEWIDCPDEIISEVVDPVPSYEKWLQLKELLEECREVIEWYKADCGYKDAPTENVLTKINQVLGEE